MNKHNKSALYLTTALSFGLALPIEAFAADAPVGNGMEEIVVTARRVEERLQDVPISITVFNQHQLDDKNIATGEDLAIVTPSLSVDTQFGSQNSSFSLRGFYKEIGTAATVGVFFADVVAPRGGISGSQTHAGEGAGPGYFFDLQNVQVLKGPQGTLFGRNTTGGDILIVPQKPTNDFGGYGEFSFGDYNLEGVQGVINVPINDRVRLRVGVDQKKRDGYLNNISGVGPKDFNNTNYVAARVSLVVDVTDDIENYTIGSFSQADENGPMEKMLLCNPSGGGLNPLTGSLSCAQIARDTGKYTVENGLADAVSYLRQWQIINTTTWQATDSLTVKNVASYAQLENRLATSLFGDNWILPATFPAGTLGNPLSPSPAARNGVGGLPIFQAGQHYFFVDVDTLPDKLGSAQQTFTDELQVHGTALGGRFDWQAGAYMEGSHPLDIAGADGPNLAICSNVQAQQCSDPFSYLGFTVGNTHISTGTITYRDYGIYAQGTYSILDDLKFTGGVRWTNDSTDGNFNLTQTSYPAPNTPVVSCKLPAPLGLLSNNCYLPLHVSSRQPTWVMDLDWTPIEDLLAYVKYSRGYREGGMTGTGPVDAAIGTQFLTFAPEQVDTYEIGTKYSFRGEVPGIIDLAGFYNDFSNQQVEAGFNVNHAIVNNPATPTAGITNAGSSRIFGIELNATISPIKDVTLNLDYSYLNSKIVNVKAVSLPADSDYLYQAIAVPGAVLSYTPHNKFTFTATYRLPVDESLGKISLSATDTYVGAQAVNPTLRFGGYIRNYNLLNFNVDWEGIDGGPIDAEFFMTNALNKYYETYIFDQYYTLGFVSASYGAPRMFGGRIRVHFGGANESVAETAAYTPPPPQPVAAAPVAHSYMVFFDFNKSDLTPEAASIVGQAAKNASPAKATTLTVTGHTDTVGSDAYNMRLSRRRAESVAVELEKDGIASSEIAIVAKGKHDLLVPTGDGVREPQNRRVTIVYDGGPTS